MSIKAVSLFSGAGACDAAFHEMGWQTIAFSEVDPHASAVLRYRYPGVENVGSVTDFDWSAYRGADVVAGGSPCQSFSVAGLRKGLEDDRGNLTLAFVRAVDAIQPRCILWENVPGVLSDKTNAFGCFLAALVGDDAPLVPPAECGGRWTNAGMASGPERVAAWRVLDAQYFGVAQRRRRVFVVACPRDGADPSEILFEREGVRRDSPPSREAGPGVAALTANGVGTCGADDNQGQAGHLIPEVSRCVTAGYGSRQDFETETMVAQCHGSNVGPMGTLRKGNGDVTGGVPFVAQDYSDGSYRRRDVANPVTTGTDATRSAPIIAFDTTQITSRLNRNSPKPGDPCHPVAAGAHPPAIAFSSKDHGADAGEIPPTLRGGGQVAVAIPTDDSQNDDPETIPAEADTEEVLQELREVLGEEAFQEWGLGVVAALQSTEVLRSEMYGGGISGQVARGCSGSRGAVQGKDTDREGSVRGLRVGEQSGCPPQGREPIKQRTEQPTDSVSELSPEGSQIESMLNSWLRSEAQGPRVLQHALLALQNHWKSTKDQNTAANHVPGVRSTSALKRTMRTAPDARGSGDARPETDEQERGGEGRVEEAPYAVRRLTPVETERLQGYPDDWTRWGKDESGKVYEISDTQRYRMIGNGWALPVVAWIARRINQAIGQRCMEAIT